MEDNLKVQVGVEVISIAVLLKNGRFGHFLFLSSCSFLFFHLAYPLSKEYVIVCLSYELKEEFNFFNKNQIFITAEMERFTLKKPN